jgi:catechol 2,3-dioxygenase-like lactoylglutathione lyase family enzyme
MSGISGVYETVLYTSDVAATAEFYEDALGLRALTTSDLVASFRLEDGGVLLIFDRNRSAAAGRLVPSHGTHGPGHVAFSVRAGELAALEASLTARGIEIERDLTWDAGGRSIYVRDPAGNSVELIEGEAWAD